MPPLPNPKHELLARNLVKNNFNKMKAYEATYNVSPATAEGNASSTIAKYGVDNRAREILEKRKKLSCEGVLNSLESDLKAKRAIPTDKPLVYVRDNASILETKKTLLKIHGVLKSDGGASNTFNDNRTLNTNVDKKTVEALGVIVGRLEKLADKTTLDLQSGEIEDAEALKE